MNTHAHRPILLLLALTLSMSPACFGGDEPEENKDTEQVISQLDTCDEHDFAPSGWMGPGVGEDGKIIDPATSYVMAGTAGLPRASETEQVAFGAHNMAITEDLFTRDGFIAANLGGSDACRTGRTMSLWRDQDAMMQFVLGDAHQNAMIEVSEVLQESKTSHWTFEPNAQGDFPTWETYAEHMDELDATIHSEGE
jgi:hypothetical protein